MTSFYEQLQSLQFHWRDALDILIVAFILYNILKLIRGTRAMQMSIGLLVLAAAYFGARAFELLALESLARDILFYMPFAIIVLFQHEIRRALVTFGRNPLAVLFSHRPSESHHQAIVEAARALSKKRVGALIVVERTQSLRMYVETGKPIDALISAELLVNVFTPNTPLHDGAVVIQGNRIAAASVFLPLSSNVEASNPYGTRHRAALGLSEESDAVVVIVSEENGSIAAALEGTLHEDLRPEQLEELLRPTAGLREKRIA